MCRIILLAVMRAAPLTTPLCAWALAAAAGCGGSSAPKPISGAPARVAVAVQALERATARGDFEEVCDELMTARARRLSGGRDCAERLRRAAARLRDPRIRIDRIEVEGEQASVRVTTTARGQGPVTETLELVRERGRFRIASLSA
jgi:hypothetical protein